MRAVVYLRQSLDRKRGTEEEGLAVARQEADCRGLCAERGWTISEVIADNDTSASNGKARAGFQRVLTMVDARAVDVVVAWHVDRLVRKLADLEDVIERCERAGVRLATVSGDIDLSTDAGRLVGRILASVARGEVERKGARQRRANLQRAEAGAPSLWGHRAFGYEPDRVSVRPAEARAVAEACDQLLSGGSLRSIAKQWHAAGLELPAGGQRWRATSVRSILLNPRIAGFRTYSPSTSGPGKREIVGAGQWPALVGEQTWRAVEALLRDRARDNGRGVRSLLGGGLSRCGGCGGPIGAGRTRAGKPNYRCRTLAEGGTSGHVSRLAAPIDTYITDVVIERLSRPDAAELLVDQDRPDMDKLRAEATALRARLEMVAVEFADGDLSAAQLRIINERIGAKLAAVETEMAEAGRLSVLGPLVRAADVRAAWDRLDLDRRRAIIDALMEVTLHSPGYGRKPFDPGTIEIGWRQP